MEGQTNRYQFVAVSSDGKKMSGTIWAVTEAEARQKISERGLALFSINEFSADKAAVTEGFQQFEFEGTEASGKPVHGTIEATDSYEAYAKLRKDYDFDLKNVIDLSATPEERLAYQKQGIPAEWLERFKIENGKDVKEEVVKKEKEEPLLSEQDRAELLFYQEEIGRVTKDVMELLKENEEYMDVVARREILDRINLLSRLRRSNAIEHLRELTKKLLKQLGDDKIFIEAEGLSEEKQAELLVRKNQFGVFSQQLEKKVVAGLASVSVGFASIDKEKVKAQIIQSDPFLQIVRVFYIAMVSLLGLMVVFWVVNIVRLFINFSQGSIWYSFSSLMLWILTGVALIFSFGLFPILYYWKTLSYKRKYFFIGISIIAVIFFLWFSPMLFWWTR